MQTNSNREGRKSYHALVVLLLIPTIDLDNWSYKSIVSTIDPTVLKNYTTQQLWEH